MTVTPRDPKPATSSGPSFEMFCARCGVSQWVSVAACDGYERDGWPQCCGRQVCCFVFARREAQPAGGVAPQPEGG